MGIDKARIAARKALERMYQGRATVIEYQKVKDEYGMTNFQEVTVLEDQPCKLSFETLTSSNGDPVATVSQSVKLFISPDVVIKAGSKIIVTQHGRTTEYSNSGGSRRLPHPPRNNVDPVQWVGVNRYSLFRVSEMSG